MTWLYCADDLGCWDLWHSAPQGPVTILDSQRGRCKTFLFVGIAYFLTAVLAPLVLLMARAAFSGYTGSGV